MKETTVFSVIIIGLVFFSLCVVHVDTTPVHMRISSPVTSLTGITAEGGVITLDDTIIGNYWIKDSNSVDINPKYYKKFLEVLHENGCMYSLKRR